mgnify:CR=1 FL=1
MFEELYNLIFTSLFFNSPILSGNMKAHIKITSIDDKKATLVIEAPNYDLKLWNKDKTIVYTGVNKYGLTDYAYNVNKYGAFGKHNKSEGWVNRTLLNACQTIANQYGGEVINEL